MKIVVKESDKLVSTLHKGKVISEYLVYLMDGDKPLMCYIEFGEPSKNDRVNDIILNHFVTDNWKKDTNMDGLITEISYNEFKNEQN